MIKLYALLFFLALASTPCLGSQKRFRKCIQCQAGNFMDMEWLMVDPHKDQVMQWKPIWARTDCLEGIVRTTHRCFGSCVTIKIKKFRVSGYMYDAVLKECSDNLFMTTPDLPENMTNPIYENKTYHAQRDGHVLEYEFSLKDSDNSTAAAKALGHILPHHKQEEVASGSKFIYALTVVFIAALLFFTYYCFLSALCKKPTHHRASYRESDDTVEIDVVPDNRREPVLVEVGEDTHGTEHNLRNHTSHLSLLSVSNEELKRYMQLVPIDSLESVHIKCDFNYDEIRRALNISPILRGRDALSISFSHDPHNPIALAIAYNYEWKPPKVEKFVKCALTGFLKYKHVSHLLNFVGRSRYIDKEDGEDRITASDEAINYFGIPMVPCATTCLTVTIEKHTDKGLAFEALAKGCADRKLSKWDAKKSEEIKRNVFDLLHDVVHRDVYDNITVTFNYVTNNQFHDSFAKRRASTRVRTATETTTTSENLQDPDHADSFPLTEMPEASYRRSSPNHDCHQLV